MAIDLDVKATYLVEVVMMSLTAGDRLRPLLMRSPADLAKYEAESKAMLVNFIKSELESLTVEVVAELLKTTPTPANTETPPPPPPHPKPTLVEG